MQEHTVHVRLPTQRGVHYDYDYLAQDLLAEVKYLSLHRLL